jgi:hypothetical protein
LIAAVFSLNPLQAKKQDKPAAANASFSVIAGTAYRPPGLSLSGARVRIRPLEVPKQNTGAKLKGAEATTDSRGEFAFRVPAVPAKWSVEVSAGGYQPQSKTVSIEGEQRIDLSFVLEPETKN